jgi:hypothetical protein
MYLVKSATYEALPYEFFAIFLSLHPSWDETFSSVSCSQTPPVYERPLKRDTKFHIYTKYRQNAQTANKLTLHTPCLLTVTLRQTAYPRIQKAIHNTSYRSFIYLQFI